MKPGSIVCVKKADCVRYKNMLYFIFEYLEEGEIMQDCRTAKVKVLSCTGIPLKAEDFENKIYQLPLDCLEVIA